jgi:DNA-binding response OmpR family regulator
MPKKIFVADDDRSIRELVRGYFEKEGYDVEVFDDGISLFDAVTAGRIPDMLILDVMMPGMDGLSVCRSIRSKSDVPIIIISAKDEEVDRILGLELGGDDYLSKPFSPRELVVRAKKIFTRLEKGRNDNGNQLFYLADLTLDPERRTVKKDNNKVDFTLKEFELLLVLVKNKGRVFTRDQLIRDIWGYEFIGETRAVDDLVKRIRKKIKEASSAAVIETVWGYGYKAGDAKEADEIDQ